MHSSCMKKYVTSISRDAPGNDLDHVVTLHTMVHRGQSVHCAEFPTSVTQMLVHAGDFFELRQLHATHV